MLDVHAELLRAAGVRTVNELKFRNPKKLALATRPVVALDSPNSVLIDPSTNVIVPRSTESKKNATAMMMKIVR